MRIDKAIKMCRGMYWTEGNVPTWETDKDWKQINILKAEGKL